MSAYIQHERILQASSFSYFIHLTLFCDVSCLFFRLKVHTAIVGGTRTYARTFTLKALHHHSLTTRSRQILLFFFARSPPFCVEGDWLTSEKRFLKRYLCMTRTMSECAVWHAQTTTRAFVGVNGSREPSLYTRPGHVPRTMGGAIIREKATWENFHSKPITVCLGQG